MALYYVQVDIYEPSRDFPVVQHRFNGRTREEARGYHEAHRKSDSFLRQCEDKGVFDGRVMCRAIVREGRG